MPNAESRRRRRGRSYRYAAAGLVLLGFLFASWNLDPLVLID